MTRYREIMRLSAMGQPPADVTATTGCGDSTVRRALKAAEAAGLAWPPPEEMRDDAIRKLIYPRKFGKRGDFADPDYERVHEKPLRVSHFPSPLKLRFTRHVKKARPDARIASTRQRTTHMTSNVATPIR